MSDFGHDAITELVGEGTDEIRSIVDINLAIASLANIENVTFTGALNAAANGNALANVITGNSGDNRLEGGDENDTLIGGAGDDDLIGEAGKDVMAGGQGHDTYYVDALDQISEKAGEGTDMIVTNLTTILGANFEDLSLETNDDVNGTGNAADNAMGAGDGKNRLEGLGGNDRLFGSGGNDTLVGGAGNDDLDGETGDDVMEGGAGNDTYIYDALGDKVVELAGQGIDQIRTWISIDLTAVSAHVENVLVFSSTNTKVTGNALNNEILGANGDDTLIGSDGNDTLDGGPAPTCSAGGAGNDIYLALTKTRSRRPRARGSTRSEASSAFFMAANVENFTLLGGSQGVDGNGQANLITGAAGNDSLNGGTNNDTLIGGVGNDRLQGGTGNDLLIGGKGDDSYEDTDLGDKYVEKANEGIDTVSIFRSFTLAANFENLTLFELGGDASGTGNAAGNTIIRQQLRQQAGRKGRRRFPIRQGRQ